MLIGIRSVLDIAYTQWRKKNPNHHRGDYPRVKAWLDRHPGYLKRYRETHPEYVQKNRQAKRLRYRQKRLRVDIQNKIKRQPPEIIDQLLNLSYRVKQRLMER